MPNINLLTGKVRLLKSDERLLSQAVGLIDCMVNNFDQLFGEDEALTKAFEAVREPLGVIEKAVEAKFTAKEASADAADGNKQHETQPPKIAATG